MQAELRQMPNGGVSPLPEPFPRHHNNHVDPSRAYMAGGGETGASPIPMSSPSRRQTSLSPNAYRQHVAAAPSPRTATRHAPASSSFLGGGVSELDEEIKIIEMIFSTLSSSLAYYEYGQAAANNTGGTNAEIATPGDAKNFISHFNAVITYAVAHTGLQERAAAFGAHGAFSAEAALIRLIFECPFDVIEILTNLAQSAYRSAYVPPRSSRVLESLHGNDPRGVTARPAAATAASISEDFVSLRLSAIEALKQLLNVSIEAANRPRPTTQGIKHTNTSAAKRTSSVLDSIQRAFSRCGTIKALLSVVLLPTAPEVLRVAAIETIFVFSMRCFPDVANGSEVSRHGAAKNATSADVLRSLLMTNYDALLKAVAMDASPQVRCYAAAVIRQLTQLFPRHSQVSKSVPVLLRSMVQDSLHEVSALCASSLDIVVRRAALELDHSAVVGGIENVVGSSCQVLEKACGSYAVVLRLQAPGQLLPGFVDGSGARSPVYEASSVREVGPSSDDDARQFDVLEALANLLHACVLFALSAVSADLQTVLRAFIMQGVIPRLARLCRVQHIPTARAAATCLAVMVLRAPPSFGIPLALAEPRAAVHLVHSVVSKSMPAGPISMEEDEQLRHATALFLFEISISVACSFLFSPLARAHWRKLLGELPTWEAPFIQRLKHSLNSAELQLFADIVIQDECGVSLNDIAAVDWDDEMHPSAHSIQCLVDAQEVRRAAKNGSLGASLTHWRGVEQERRRPDTKRGYLCFVLMGYAYLKLDSTSAEVRPPVIVSLEGERFAHASTLPREEQQPHHAVRWAEAANDVQGTVGDSTVHRPLFPRVASPLPSGGFPTHSAAQLAKRRQPNASNRKKSVSPQQRQLHVVGRGEVNDRSSAPDEELFHHLYKEFQAALDLAIFLSSHYHRKRLSSSEITRGSGAPPPAVSRLAPSSASTLRGNPYAKALPRGADRSLQMRAWTSTVVEEGDLFFFYIPLSALSVNVIEAVIGKARKHQTQSKKNFVITPQNQKERRWFLLDMHTTIMPKLIVLLQSLKKLLAVHTEENVRMSLQVLPSVHIVGRGSGEKAITCSNLRNVCDFASQTFSIRMTTAAMDDAGSLSNTAAQNGIMSSSFFAPLFPPSSHTADGGEALAEGRRSSLFDVAPHRAAVGRDDDRGDSSESEMDELEIFGGKTTDSIAQDAYSIRRLSTVLTGSNAVSRREAYTAKSPHVKQADDNSEDDSFELMQF